MPRNSHGWWPVVVLLVVAVAVPTACVLWFMTLAMGNERLAVRQRLTDTYRGQLDGINRKIEPYWDAKAKVLAEVDPDAGPAKAFAAIVATGQFDSALVFAADGRLRYPFAASARKEPEQPDGAWTQAMALEYQGSDPGQAALRYAAIAASAAEANSAARALLAQARCLTKAGQTAPALAILSDKLTDTRYRDSVDWQGRLLVPNAQLFALQVINDARDQRYGQILQLLVQRVTDYGDGAMSAGQRLFLMEQLQQLAPGAIMAGPTLAAERLAAQLLDTEPGYEGTDSARLSPTDSPDVWRMSIAASPVVGLLTQDRLLGDLRDLSESAALPKDVDLTFVTPGTDWPRGEPFLAMPATDRMPGWRLALYLVGPDPFAAAAQQQLAVYLWTGILAIVVIIVLALSAARFVGRQMKLTRLKNDLIATVSHELKTPLSSMRVLVETLAAGRCRDQHQVGEYLQLLTKENQRLSRLIDNFLAFSRMERNRQAFDFQEVQLQAIITEAVEAAGERFEAAGCSVVLDVRPDIPPVQGDKDALVTVLLNLLDNALKYTEDHKRIALRAYHTQGHVCLEVTDNGIGMPRRAVRRIFDRFYQVDRRLSRRAGGCGLGLSIVKFIVAAHGGSMDVSSELGKGSSFTVKLPIG